eukprot:sb/3476316/
MTLTLKPLAYWCLINAFFLELDPYVATLFPCLSAPISLTKCNDEASRLEFVEEPVFMKDREIFVNVEPMENDQCDFKACGFNTPVEAVKSFRPTFASQLKVHYFIYQIRPILTLGTLT